MIGSTRQVRVFVHREAVDMRKQLDVLSVLAEGALKRPLLSVSVRRIASADFA